MTPSRAVFRQLFKISNDLMDTYDYLPDAEAQYPFCFVENGRNIQTNNSDLMGTVSTMVHWFCTRDQVGDVDLTVARFHDELKSIDSFLPYNMSMKNWIDRPQPEAPDSPGIMHFIAEIDIDYTRKEVKNGTIN